MNTTDYGLNTAAYDYPNVILSNSTLYIPAHALVDLPTLTASNSLASVTSTISEYVVKDQTYTVTEILLGSTTVTITAPPSTITVYQPPITTTTTVTVAPNATETASTWSMPSHITDLSPFNVTKYSGGTSNINIVTGIPSSASASPTPIAISMSISPESSEVTFYEELEYSDWRNDTSALQLFYPENSVNPGRRPIGGAQFYATPIDLDNVELKLVSLTYSVFFPVDFDFVLGGKLPGLYGGRAGCSGGDEALDCFSTRLMWRKNGLGELYLYAPKDEQTEALCAHPQSVCDSTYGFSLGRGSFSWRLGRWTTVVQLVRLNTPGKQDGFFQLNVNGKHVFNRTDVYYLSDPDAEDDDDDDDGGLLGLFDREPEVQLEFSVLQSRKKLVNFVGLFFSTFFGGHDDKYAAPRDQYVWFKDFAIAHE